MRLLAIFLFAALGLAASVGSVQAQPYIGVRVGANFEPDDSINTTGINGSGTYEPGLATSGVIGYRFGLPSNFAVSVEGEFAYRRNDIDTMSAAGFPDHHGGYTQSFIWVGNAWVSYEIGDSGFAPYIGGGGGAIHVDVLDAQIDGTSLRKEADLVLCGQVGGGLGYRLGEHVELSLDYRYLFTEPVTIQSFHIDYQSHSAMVGVKYLF